MRITAFMTIRNERPYLRNCLSHLIANGIDYYIVDNESDDGTLDILKEPRFARHLVGLESYPFNGVFEWEGLLSVREAAADASDCDWVLSTAPDEIIHPYSSETLHEAISRIAAAGYDAIDCDELVFLPIDQDYVSDLEDVQPLRHYYWHRLEPGNLVRARKRDLAASHIKSGGHSLAGENLRLAPERLALRHYMFLSQEHALRKYPERQFPAAELKRGWHRQRANRDAGTFVFPDPSRLHRLDDPATRSFDMTRPYSKHYWLW